MKKYLFLSLFFITNLFSEENELNKYMNSNDHLKSVNYIGTYVSASSESTIGSNNISLNLTNKEGENVSFPVLKDQPIIITDCDFKIKKERTYFYSRMNSDCDKILSKEAQKKYIFDILYSLENKIKYIYNKGDVIH